MIHVFFYDYLYFIMCFPIFIEKVLLSRILQFFTHLLFKKTRFNSYLLPHSDLTIVDGANAVKNKMFVLD